MRIGRLTGAVSAALPGHFFHHRDFGEIFKIHSNRIQDEKWCHVSGSMWFFSFHLKLEITSSNFVQQKTSSNLLLLRYRLRLSKNAGNIFCKYAPKSNFGGRIFKNLHSCINLLAGLLQVAQNTTDTTTSRSI